MSSITITGDKSLDIALATLEPAIRTRALRKAVRTATQTVVDDAKAKAPKRTGAYAKTIKILGFRRSRRNKHIIAYKAANSPKELERIYKERGRAINPHWLEFGTDDTPPQPHFRPAFEAGKAVVKGVFMKALPSIIRKAADKVRGKRG